MLEVHIFVLGDIVDVDIAATPNIEFFEDISMINIIIFILSLMGYEMLKGVEGNRIFYLLTFMVILDK